MTTSALRAVARSREGAAGEGSYGDAPPVSGARLLGDLALLSLAQGVGLVLGACTWAAWSWWVLVAVPTFLLALADAGVLESLNGLHPPTSGVQVRFGEDGSSVSDIESAGAVGGYWILNVSSHEAAVEWARRCPALPGDVLELRQIQEMDDFPEDVQDVVAGYDL